MARLFSSGFELNSATSGIEWTLLVGAPTVQGTTKRSGDYAMEVSGMSSGVRSMLSYTFEAVNNNGPFYARGYFLYVTAPTANNQIFTLQSTGGTRIASVMITSTGTLALRDEDGTIGSASSVLSTNTWYRVELLVDVTAAAGSHVVRAYLDGIEFAGANNRNLSAGVALFRIGGNVGLEAQTQGEWYWDDVAVNDSTGSFQNSLPGEGEIVHLRPSANGDNTQLGAASNNFQAVDEVTPDDTTTEIDTGANSIGDIDDYNIDNAPAALAANETINLVSVGFRFSGDNATQANNDTVVVRIKASSGGTVEESASIQPSSTSYVTNAIAEPRIYPLILYDLPGASTTTWTKANLDAAQIGVRKSADSTSGVDFSTLWLLVDHKPTAVAAGTWFGYYGPSGYF